MDFEVRHIDGTTVKLISSEHKCAITSATQTRKLCGNDTVTINLQSATYIDFYVGDKITIFGTTYTLNQLPTVKKESERSYTYTLVFEGLQYTLIDRVFLMPDNTQGDNLMFDLAGMLDVLDDNINRGNSGKQYEFVLDESLEETEYKNLSLTGKNCLQVLQQLCQEWDTEFVFAEEANRIAIYIGVAGSTFPTTFKYGRGGGVYELNREKGASDICTRLFVYGGTQNLTYYRHNRLCLPSKEKNQSYVEDATAQAVYGIKEQVKNFDDIYPNRIGTITSLSGCDYNEFIDSDMADEEFGFDLNEKWANNADDCEEWLALKGLEDTPENEAIYYNDVAETATKYLMAGATAKIHFNTGALAGYECDLHSYTHSSQKFVLKPLVDENGYDFPSKTNAAFKLAVGDEYVILDINLPTAYKTQAESKLATEAASYFDTVCRPQPKYTLTIEPIALKHIVGPSTADTEIFKVGDLINISDPTGGVESATIRIDQFVRNLLDPFDYKLTLTDEITYSQQVRTLIEVDAIKRVVEESKIYDVNRIRRGWKDAEELYNQMFDTEGHYYSEKIAPLSIDTQMLKVGARSQQLVLQNVLFQPNYNANPANLQISAGSLVHYTIAEPDIKTWTMSALSASNVPSTAQYVYAKCAKNGTTGTWLVTDQAIIFDSDPSYYHFLVGSLSSVDSVSNTRNFAATYGFTTINGRNITTGVIKSSDGSSVVIDLDAGIIKGNITFESGTTSYDALQGIISGNDTVQGAVTTANTANNNASSAVSTANTANATANRAEGKIDGLEIGGRNLLLDSADEWQNIATNASWKQLNIATTPLETGQTYVISFDAKTSNGTDVFYAGLAVNDTSRIVEQQIKPTTEYTRMSVILENTGAYASLINSVIVSNAKAFNRGNENNSGTLYIKNIKLEKGNKATDWTPAPEDTEAELTALQTDLQGQIDKKIETFYQTSDPSTGWTAAQKTAHTGDLWYYTGSTSGSLKQDATYRWSGSAWVEQQAAKELFDKIDGKSAIWYNSTATGYNPTGVEDGDFLVLNDGSGKSYRRLNGAWVSVQDYQAAIAKLELPNMLRNAELVDLNNDVFSGSTSFMASDVWDGVQCYNVDSAHKLYVNFPTLNIGDDYLFEFIYTRRYSSKVLRIEIGGELVLETTTNDTNWRKVTATFKATANTTRAVLYVDDSSTSWTFAFQNFALRQNTIGGGLNLLPYSEIIDKTKSTFSSTNASQDSVVYDGINTYATNPTSKVVVTFPTLNIGAVCVLSFKYKRTYTSKPLRVDIGSVTKSIPTVQDETWRLYTITFVANASTTKADIYADDSSSQWTLGFKEFKLEYGNKATDWTPANNDTYGRLENIDSNSVFSMAEKQAFRTDFEKIVGVGIAVGGTIPTAADLIVGSTYAKGSYYQHYNKINSTAKNTLNALSTAYTNLRNYLVGNTCLLYTQQDTSGFSRTSLAQLICAYLDAEIDIDFYAENVGALEGVCDSGSNGTSKRINCYQVPKAAMLQDMLADVDMRMRVTFNFSNTATTTTFTFRNDGGATPQGLIPTDCSSYELNFYYNGVTSNNKCYWLDGMVFELKYRSATSTAVTLECVDESSLKAGLMIASSLQGTTTIAGGLVLTRSILMQDSADNVTAGITGLKEGGVAFFAGGTLAEAIAGLASVIINRDGLAKFGKVYIDGRKSICQLYMVDSSGKTRFLLRSGSLKEHPAVKVYNSGNSGDSGVRESTSASLSANATTTQQTYYIFPLANMTGSGTNPQNYNYTFQINIQLQIALTSNGAGYYGYTYVDVQYYDGNTWASAASYSIRNDIADTIEESVNVNVRYDNDTTPAQRGLRVVYWKDSAPSAHNTGIQVDSVSWCYYGELSDRLMQIAANGMEYFYDTNNMFKVKYGNSKLTTSIFGDVSIKGNVDMPGVLFAGQVTSGGVVNEYYRNKSKIPSAITCSTYTSSRYAVTHSIGSTNYAVIAQAIGTTVRAVNVAVPTGDTGKTTFYVYPGASTAFMLIIYGSN